MSQSVALLAPVDWSLDTLARIVRTSLTSESREVLRFDEQLEVRGLSGRPWSPSWIVVVRQDARRDQACEWYEDCPGLPEELRETLRMRSYFGVSFDNLDAARDVLSAIARAALDEGNDALWIDSDYGWLITAQGFVRMLGSDPEWDWRTDVVPEFGVPTELEDSNGGGSPH